LQQNPDKNTILQPPEVSRILDTIFLLTFLRKISMLITVFSFGGQDSSRKRDVAKKDASQNGIQCKSG
jgi:hypothetical protein